MKSILLAILLTLSLFSFNCNHGNAGNVPVTRKTDTLKKVVLYKFRGQLLHDLGIEIVRDSLMPSKKDSLRNEWVIFTTTYIPYYDTARDKQGQPMKDSSGKFIPAKYWISIPKDSVYGSIPIEIDSLLKTLK